MDTSETYIKMSDCPEIQKEARYIGDNMEELGNWFAFYVTGKWQPPVIYTYGLCLPYERGDYAVWLPRQDQLQEMVKEGNKFSYTNNLVLAGKFDKFCSWQANDITSLDWSMEQLWLAFGMFKKYNKVWTNNEWRNGSE